MLTKLVGTAGTLLVLGTATPALANHWRGGYSAPRPYYNNSPYTYGYTRPTRPYYNNYAYRPYAPYDYYDNYSTYPVRPYAPYYYNYPRTYVAPTFQFGFGW